MFRFFRRPPAPALSPVLAATEALAPVSAVKVLIAQDVCHHCGGCVAVCPPDVIFLDAMHLTIDQDGCTACERCVKMCPVHALEMAAPKESRHARSV
ncbi:MAG: 4Fe-4S binding protein [Anaerolineae bacterium]|nr:4Fe-4S binding protein [Anaerolineae bacterium]